MSKVLTDPQNYTDIANAIRGKNGSSTTYTPSEMAAAIEALSTGDSTVKFVSGTFNAGSGSAYVSVTFDQTFDSTPDIIMFWEAGNNSSYRSTSRTKYAVGAKEYLMSQSASAYASQRCAYGSTNSSSTYFTSSYPITYTGTSTANASYPCIRSATATGFVAYQRYYSSTSYPLYGTYNYVAFCL